MSVAPSYPISFLDGTVVSRNSCVVLVQYDEIREAGESDTSCLLWDRNNGRWTSIFTVEWIATRIVSLDPSGRNCIATGPAGIVAVLQGAEVEEEEIDDTNGGLRGGGNLRDLRVIGERVYVAGMSRRVYRREDAGRWTAQDAGTAQEPGALEVFGFNSIDGQNEQHVIAVGFGGEIWLRSHGKWTKMESPTNVVLTCVRMVGEDVAFACGQKGVIAHCRNGLWRILEHQGTTDDLWSLERFGDDIYVAAENRLYRLKDENRLEPVELGLEGSRTFRHLHATDGVLWSFGPKHLSWSEDGILWYEATPGRA